MTRKSRLAGRHRTGQRKRADVAKTPQNRKVLVVDVGGTPVKVLTTDEDGSFPSGPKLIPRRMASGVKRLTQNWVYDVVSMGYPGPVLHGRPIAELYNLGHGWVGFDFSAAFGCPREGRQRCRHAGFGELQG
jgi:polyphosphate glucokinase